MRRTQQHNSLVDMVQHQLDTSMRLADAVFLGTGKIDRVILDATHNAVENNLQMARAMTDVQDTSRLKELQTNFAYHPEKNMQYQQQIISAVAEMQAEFGKSVQSCIERFGQSAAGRFTDAIQKNTEGESNKEEGRMFNPVTSMFSVWERAFRDAATLTNKNLSTVSKTVENAMHTAKSSASEEVTLLEPEEHESEHAERKHSAASKKK